MNNSAIWSKGLEGPALEIAGTPNSPLRVDAGPGTGKTFTLIRRVCRLLEEGANPRRVLVSTFTRTSATDLKNSLAELGVDGAEAVRAGTIHGFCFGLLSREVVLEQTGRVPRPLLNFEERFLLQDLHRDYFGSVRERDRRLKAFNAAWARLQSDEPGWPHDPVDQQFHTDLMAWFRFHRAMHIGELVWLALQYLRENPTSQFRTAFDHVLVDEYQDMNRAEQVLLDILAENSTLTVTGDEDQSIYSFRHAHPEGIQDFSVHHPGTHDASLLDCHRCPRRVIEMANALIARNQFRSPRVLQPMETSPEGEIYVVQWTTMEEEAQGLARFITQKIEGGEVEPGRVLALSPRRQFGYRIRDALMGQDVPAHSFFLEEELGRNPANPDRCQAQEAFTLLTLLANPADLVALRCWCGFRSPSLNRGGWARLREYCEQQGLSPRDALRHVSDGEISIPYVSRVVPRFQALETRLAELEPLRGQELVDALFPLDQGWAEPLRTLSESQAEGNCDASSLREVLRTVIAQPELPTDVAYVRVMSLHKSKGLTADLVVVTGCIEGLIPFVPDGLPIADEVQVAEEQRRLFYVAITRSRRILVLSSATRLPRDLAHRMGAHVHGGDYNHAHTTASKFLSELGPSRPETVLGQEIL